MQSQCICNECQISRIYVELCVLDVNNAWSDVVKYIWFLDSYFIFIAVDIQLWARQMHTQTIRSELIVYQ